MTGSKMQETAIQRIRLDRSLLYRYNSATPRQEPMPVVETVDKIPARKTQKLRLPLILILWRIKLKNSPTTRKHENRPASQVKPIFRSSPMECCPPKATKKKFPYVVPPFVHTDITLKTALIKPGASIPKDHTISDRIVICIKTFSKYRKNPFPL